AGRQRVQPRSADPGLFRGELHIDRGRALRESDSQAVATAHTGSGSSVTDLGDFQVLVARRALPDHRVADRGTDQYAGERRNPADLAGRRIGLVLADDREAALLIIIVHSGHHGAEGDLVPWLARQIDDDGPL